MQKECPFLKAHGLSTRSDYRLGIDICVLRCPLPKCVLDKKPVNQAVMFAETVEPFLPYPLQPSAFYPHSEL